MKMTSDQFDALVELMRAIAADEARHPRNSHGYCPDKVADRVRALFVLEEDETPAPVEEKRVWRVDAPPDCGYRFGVVDQHGTWWTDKHGAVWTSARKKVAQYKARDLNYA